VSRESAGIAKRSEPYFQGDAQALGVRAQLRLAGEEPAIVEKLRAKAPHQLAVPPFGLPHFAAQKILNRR